MADPAPGMRQLPSREDPEMTYRLVGLMSLVLLVSLAAFALLMTSYQAEVMDEVTRTVSRVGRATLQTFEVPGILPLEQPGPDAGGHIVIARHGYSYETHSGSSPFGAHGTQEEGITVIHREDEPGGSAKTSAGDPHSGGPPEENGASPAQRSAAN